MKDRPETTTTTYILTLKTEEPGEIETLVKLGFERKFDNEPFIFTTKDFDEMGNALFLIQEEEDYEGSWTLTKEVS